MAFFGSRWRPATCDSGGGRREGYADEAAQDAKVRCDGGGRLSEAGATRSLPCPSLQHHHRVLPSLHPPAPPAHHTQFLYSATLVS
jgi:hypothetical protein